MIPGGYHWDGKLVAAAVEQSLGTTAAVPGIDRAKLIINGSKGRSLDVLEVIKRQRSRKYIPPPVDMRKQHPLAAAAGRVAAGHGQGPWPMDAIVMHMVSIVPSFVKKARWE